MKYLLHCLLLALLLCSGATAHATDATRSIWQAQFQLSDNDSAVTVSLPHVWSAHQLSHEQYGRYTLNLGTVPTDEIYAVLLPKLVMSAHIRLNGISLFKPARTEEPLSRHWNTPLRVYVPRSAIRDHNVLEIELFTYPGYGLLAPVFIGPKADIDAIYKHRIFWQQTINKYLFAISLCAAAFSMLLWLHQPRRTAFLYFGLASVCWSFYNLNLFIVSIPVSGKLWWWWVHSCIDLWAVLMVLFSHRIIDVYHPRAEQALLSFALGASAVYFVSDLSNFAAISNRLHLVSFGLLAYIALRHLARWRQPNSAESRLLAVGSVVMLALATNDMYINSYAALALIDANEPLRWLHRFSLAPMAEPLFACAMLWLLIKHYTRLAHNIDDLQQNLEAKIQHITRDYQREQLNLQQLHISQAAAAERQHIYQNLYEDLADKLSAIYHSATDAKQADAAQAAIAELRDTAQTHQQQQHQLDLELANIRIEFSKRCEQAKLQLEWTTMQELPPLALSSSRALALKRIMREALSNILKHADATTVAVSLGMSADNTQLQLWLADNGRGIAANASNGRGMANMYKRADDIGALLSIKPHPAGGTIVELQLPCGG